MPSGLRPLEAYEALHRTLIVPGSGRVYLAYVDDEPVSAALFLHLGRRALSLYSGSNAPGLEVYGEYGMYWQAIADLAQRRICGSAIWKCRPGRRVPLLSCVRAARIQARLRASLAKGGRSGKAGPGRG